VPAPRKIVGIDQIDRFEFYRHGDRARGGGFVTASKNAPYDGVVTEAILTSGRYLVILVRREYPCILFDYVRLAHVFACAHAAFPSLPSRKRTVLDVQKRQHVNSTIPSRTSISTSERKSALALSAK
jgi:hypothetical protein